MPHPFQLDQTPSTKKSTYIGSYQITYWDTETGDDAILMVHGNSLSSQIFYKQFTDMGLRKFRLIALDLPGHGESEKISIERYTLDEYGFIISEFIKQLGIKQCVVLGLSLGGHSAMYALPFCPEIRGIALCGAPPLESIDQMMEAYFPIPEVQSLFQASISREQRSAIVQISASHASSEAQQLIEDDIKRTDPMAREGLMESLQKNGLINEIKAIDNAHIPVLVLQGAEEIMVSVSFLNKSPIPKLWRGEIQIIPKASHSCSLENADAFNQFLLEFTIEMLG